MDQHVSPDLPFAPGQIDPIVMPICSVERGELFGYEVLSRGPAGTPWREPESFLAEAARRGRLLEMDLHCLAACWRVLNVIGGRQVVFLNVFSETLLHPGFLPWLDRVIRAAPAHDHQAVLEIHESATLHELSRLHRTLEELKARDIMVAFDDLQPGDLTPTHLELRPDFLKVDRGVLLYVDQGAARDYLGGLTTLQHEGNGLILVEGVETDGQLDMLRELGVDFAQGYLFGAPAPLSEYESEAV